MKNEKRCVSHYCEECQKKLYPSSWKTGLGVATLFMIPLFAAMVIGVIQDSKLPPPFCQKVEQLTNSVEKKTEVICPK